MRLTSDFAGSSLKDYQTDVIWRRTMNYAASVGDNNSVYFDDEREGGVVAPPMFSVAVTWPLLWNSVLQGSWREASSFAWIGSIPLNRSG